MSMIMRDKDANGLRQGSSLVRVTAQILKSAQDGEGERSSDVIPKMVSKLPRGSNATSQQIGQIAISINSEE
jgi:hypothetical protein